jgi:3-carboxy-cis,cis-muconate cycloisomerase
MAKNRASAGSSVYAKHLIMKLAPLVGRGQAHDIVHYTLESGGTDALCTDSNIITHFSKSQNETALDPSHYLGESVEIARLSAILAECIATRLKKAQAKWRIKYLNTELCLLLGIPVTNI